MPDTHRFLPVLKEPQLNNFPATFADELQLKRAGGSCPVSRKTRCIRARVTYLPVFNTVLSFEQPRRSTCDDDIWQLNDRVQAEA
jgi:hypothetical protein